MNDKRGIKNTVIATVIGSIIFSTILWLFNWSVDNFDTLQANVQQNLSSVFSWRNSSEFIVGSSLLIIILFFRYLCRPTLKSRVLAYKNKLLKLIRFN